MLAGVTVGRGLMQGLNPHAPFVQVTLVELRAHSGMYQDLTVDGASRFGRARRRTRPPQQSSGHLRVIRDGMARIDSHVERDRRIAVPFDLDVMRTRLEIQVLEHAVVVVDHACIVAVDEHLGVTRCVDDADGAVGEARSDGVVPIASRVTAGLNTAGRSRGSGSNPDDTRTGGSRTEPHTTGDRTRGS